ncbi:MAG TPA: YggT family protein [Chthonomonadaceae bacterium]|nr:YggT family protein [Chthonomonadaceae bacterium]
MFIFLPMNTFPGILYNVIGLLMILILIEVIISNIIAFGGKLSPYHPFVRFVRSIVNPIVNPIRRLLPPPHRTGGWDFSPMLAMVLLEVLRRVLISMLH